VRSVELRKASNFEVLALCQGLDERDEASVDQAGKTRVVCVVQASSRIDRMRA
jgi:hypothetical protein